MYDEAVSYWTIGLQYFHLVKAIVGETIKQNNAFVIISDEDISWDQYELDTKWSDHRLIIPVLFDFYHGVEIILKGFLIAAGKLGTKNHELSKLLSEFEKYYSNGELHIFFTKYIDIAHLPDLLKDFCKESSITMDDYYQALKYPKSNRGNKYFYLPLKYKGKNGVTFFKELEKDIDDAINQIVDLGRSIKP